jgi:DNA-binding XRE family transcriptional regulator
MLLPLQAEYPPGNRDAYQARAAAILAGELAELVHGVRTRAGLTQTELARRVGTTQSSIARIEGGGSMPTIDMLSRLARATGPSVRLLSAGVADIEIRRRLSEPPVVVVADVSGAHESGRSAASAGGGRGHDRPSRSRTL